jgi:hypothetical protein
MAMAASSVQPVLDVVGVQEAVVGAAAVAQGEGSAN